MPSPCHPAGRWERGPPSTALWVWGGGRVCFPGFGRFVGTEAALTWCRKELSPRPLTSRVEGVGGSGGAPGLGPQVRVCQPAPGSGPRQVPASDTAPRIPRGPWWPGVCGVSGPQPQRLLGWQLSRRRVQAPRKLGAWLGLWLSPRSSTVLLHGVSGRSLLSRGSLGEAEEGRETPSKPAPEARCPGGEVALGPEASRPAGAESASPRGDGMPLGRRPCQPPLRPPLPPPGPREHASPCAAGTAPVGRGDVAVPARF